MSRFVALFLHARAHLRLAGAGWCCCLVRIILVVGVASLAHPGRSRWVSAEGCWVAWPAFVFGICLSLVANICSAPTLSPLQVTVAACPALVLLMAVELLDGARKRRTAVETGRETASARRE